MKLAIVCPCYNEQEVLPISVGRLNELLDDLVARQKVSPDSFVMFVNDGSRDQTWAAISQTHAAQPDRFKGLDLAHNVGHQYAIMAGMMAARTMSDAVITIDADLQDDISAIERMVEAYEAGNDVVYGVKVSRQGDSAMKRISAEAFYRLQESMDVKTVFNHADFRLMSRRALGMLADYPERNVYLRGLIPLIGLPSTTVDDVISERAAGTSKYTLSKMLSLAIDGITSFSIKPIYHIFTLGFIFVLISLVIGIYVVYSLVNGSAVHGWASLILSVWLVGGMLMISLGVVGLYIGKIYREVKRRPLYHVQEELF